MGIRTRHQATLISLLVVLGSVSFGAEVRFRLSPGRLLINPEEVNLSLAAWQDEWKSRAEAFSNLNDLTGEKVSLRLATVLEAELLFALSSRLGIGLSSGYLYSELDEEKTLLAVAQDGTVYHHVMPLKLSAYPVSLSGYVFFPLAPKLGAYLRAGGGYIFAQYTGREATKKENEIKYAYSRSETARAGRPLLVGGIGLSYAFDSSFGVFFESTFQSAKITEFKGQDAALRDGTLYFLERRVPDLDFWQARLEVLPEAPEGADVRSAKLATIDFGGVSAKMGIQLRF